MNIAAQINGLHEKGNARTEVAFIVGILFVGFFLETKLNWMRGETRRGDRLSILRNQSRASGRTGHDICVVCVRACVVHVLLLKVQSQGVYILFDGI